MFPTVAHRSCSGVLAGKVILPVVGAYCRVGNPRCGYESVRAVADLNGCTITDTVCLTRMHYRYTGRFKLAIQVGACMSQRQNTKLLL